MDSIHKVVKEKPMTMAEAMALPRKQRRILGKLNRVKIPGTNTDHIPKVMYRETAKI